MIRKATLLTLLTLFAPLCGADGVRGGRPRQAMPVATSTAPNPAIDDNVVADAPKFVTESRWLTAGYNNNEIVYQVFVTNQDTHIIRCTTEVHGFYFDNGNKLSISDRQITTVLPNQPTQVGNWMDLDQASGAEYSVKCHVV